MNPVPVPRTTLACVDCQFPALALRALRLSIEQCRFEAVKLFTDDTAVANADERIEVVAIPRIASSADYSRFVLKELRAHVHTDFVQLVQWDGYVAHGEAWSDEFLDYDYIGARWWFHPEGENVGNGGFSLRSRRLLDALQDERIVARDPEDDVICRRHRALLRDEYGIRIAPSSIADRYSFEGTDPHGREFGFHRAFNLPYFLEEAELARVLDTIPDASFCHLGYITLVHRLIGLGRKREALRYAQRIRGYAPGYAALSAKSRALLERAVVGLASRVQPCPCGSGAAFERCCGAFEKWAAA